MPYPHLVLTMMKIVMLLLAVVTAAIVTSMPTSNPDLQDIAAIATQVCPAIENNESENLSVFHDQIIEAVDLVNTTLKLNSQWLSVLGQSKEVYCAEKTSKINITEVHHVDLSDIQNLRMRPLLQMSNYVHFLKSQENSTTDYANATTQLRNLRKKINNIVSTLGQLLSSVTCENITLYTEEDVSGHVITAPQATSSDKRSFCYCVLELMLRDCQSTLKSVETKTAGA